ncbi:hypothetical protein H7U08_06995 [Bacillus cereus]|uniref:Uncharacterized protein n=1 Tax=Bacillus cereus TaxID=1396 RepID=A0AAW4QPZ1_BACCE|nr:hypothetical protein [Bacillus cereus]KLA27755.1 hypothetical protein B4080_4494 [Bacillus cereus]MBY0036322.1 hypothetical protein [Bacillus cereus]
MYTEIENEFRNFEIDSFKTLAIEEYQQLLDEKYEGFITIRERPINVMAAVKHECCICEKKFYNRPANMLGDVEVLQHNCFLSLTGLDSESDKVRTKRLADMKARKDVLRDSR